MYPKAHIRNRMAQEAGKWTFNFLNNKYMLLMHNKFTENGSERRKRCVISHITMLVND